MLMFVEKTVENARYSCEMTAFVEYQRHSLFFGPNATKMSRSFFNSTSECSKDVMTFRSIANVSEYILSPVLLIEILEIV